MSGKKSIIKTMLLTMLFSLFFLSIGGVLLLQAKAESADIGEPPYGFVKLSVQIESIEKTSEQYIRNGVETTRYSYIATVNASYEGEAVRGKVSVMPLLKAGEETVVFFDPETKEIKPAIDEVLSFIGFMSYAPAVFMLSIGAVIVLVAVISAIRKLSMFREENKVYGVIVDAVENVNITIDHKHPKKAICEITDHITGNVRRVESANSKMDVFGMIGMNVPIYVNPKKPDKVFVDLENAEGELKLAEGQQRVHDFRNL